MKRIAEGNTVELDQDVIEQGASDIGPRREIGRKSRRGAQCAHGIRLGTGHFLDFTCVKIDRFAGQFARERVSARKNRHFLEHGHPLRPICSGGSDYRRHGWWRGSARNDEASRPDASQFQMMGAERFNNPGHRVNKQVRTTQQHKAAGRMSRLSASLLQISSARRLQWRILFLKRRLGQ